MSRTFRLIGVGFDHMHIGDQLTVATMHPQIDLVGVWDRDETRARAVLNDLSLDCRYTSDLAELITLSQADIAVVCSTTAEYPELVEMLASAGIHAVIEKPMANSLIAAERLLASAHQHGVILATNWPLAWYPSHRTLYRLVSEGTIGRVEQVHFYDGNRGPLYHSHGKKEVVPTTSEKAESWWYQPESGGGSMRDYLGYGTTLATWLRQGQMPTAVTAAWHIPSGLRVDEQSVTVGHYADGLSVFQTRWGTFTDPWTQQPQPGCGFVVTGTAGSIASWDYTDHVTLHSAAGI